MLWQEILGTFALYDLMVQKSAHRLWLAGIECVDIWAYRRAYYLIAQRDETKIYILETQLEIDDSQTVNGLKCWTQTWYDDLKMSQSSSSNSVTK